MTTASVSLWAGQGMPRSKGAQEAGKKGRPAWIYDIHEVGAWLVERGKATQADVDDAIERAGGPPPPPKAPGSALPIAERPKPKRKKRSADPDDEDDLATAKLKAQISKLEADCRRLDLMNKQREGSHVVVSEIHAMLAELAGELRNAGEILARDFGPEALRVVEVAIGRIEKRCQAT